jgi:hypothetical protein
MSEASAPPSVTEELNRKVIETLEFFVHQHDSLRLEDRELYAVGRALDLVTSGLTDKGVKALVHEVCKPSPAMKRHFVGKGVVRTILWAPAGSGYLISTRDATTGQRVGAPIQRKSEVGVRETELANLFSTLVKSGYTEL